MVDLQEDVASRRSWVGYLSVVVVLVLILSGLAVAGSASAAASPSSAPPAPSAVGPRHELRIGTVVLTIQTTNPVQYTLVDEYYIVGDVYSFLLNYGPDWELEPDLAVQFQQTNLNPSTWQFKLAQNAYFVDPRNCVQDGGHIVSCPTTTQVTSADVKFTFDFVKLYSSQTSYFEPCVEHVASVVVNGPFDVTIAFDGPYAPAIAVFTCLPILPKYIWQTQAITWLNPLPIGSGPYLVRPTPAGDAMATPPPLLLDRNPHWHGKEVQGRQVYPDTIQFVSYTSSGAMALDLTLGKIDLALSPNAQDYTTFLPGKPGVLRQSVPDGFEAEQAVQVLDDDLRAHFASISSRPVERGHTNPVLKHQVVRTAIHMSTNRAKMIANAWNGLATPGDTLLPLFHPLHRTIPPFSPDDKDGNGNVNDFPPFSPNALEQFPDDASAPAEARKMLVAAGWAYVCATGATQTGTEFPLCRRSATGQMVEELTFTFSTFNTEPWWETAARGVKEDSAKAGIVLNIELVNPSQMFNKWYQLDYEVWLWDWVWTPITDPSLALVVQTCGGMRTLDNDNGYCLRDPVTGRWTFDDLYNQTLVETESAARRVLTDRAQDLIYGYASYNLPFYLDQLYAMNELRFTHWVDFRANRAVPVDIGNSPVLGQVVYPVDQKPPQFTLSSFEGVVGQPVQFSVAAIDPEGALLDYRWDFDAPRNPPLGPSHEPGGAGATCTPCNADGIPDNDDQGGNTATPTFIYGATGTFVVEVRVSERAGDFFTVGRTQVTIHAAQPPAPPTVRTPSFSPSDPTIYPGDMVTFAVSASDPAGLALTQYTWNWGDGSAATTTTVPSATHQYLVVPPSGTYTAAVTVRNSAGATNTASTIVPIVANVAPVVSSLESKAVQVNLEDTFVAFASDANSRDVLTYSWTFGDGGTATGNPVSHTYTSVGSFAQELTISDAHGHSVIAAATITVLTEHNTAPGISVFTADPLVTYSGVPVTFTASVSDPDGNALRWRWDFNGDGCPQACTWEVDFTTPVTSPDAVQTRTEVYTYATGGQFRPLLRVDDIPPAASSKKNEQAFTESITLNFAPTLTDIAISPSLGDRSTIFSFSSVWSDADDDPISYTWDWADGTSTTGSAGVAGTITGSHQYSATGNYLVILTADDGHGVVTRKSVFAIVVETSPMAISLTSNRREMMGQEIATIRANLVKTSDGTPVTGATLTPSTPVPGGSFSSVRELGSGNYEFTWKAPNLTRQTFVPINVLARAPAYFDISGRVVLIVDPNKTNPDNPTQLFLLVRAPATSLRAGESMTVTVYLYTIEGYVVSGALLALLRVGPGTVSAVTDQLNGVYTFVYTAPASIPSPTGVLITISATKFGYAGGTARLALTVLP